MPHQKPAGRYGGALFSRRFNHISFELSAKIGFSPAAEPTTARTVRGTRMSSFEWNKIAGAILATMILAMVSGIIASILVRPRPLEHPAYMVAGGEATQPKAAAGTEAAKVEPIGPLLAKADVNAGKDVAKKCVQCHTFEKGGPNRIGPNLYGIVGEPIAQGKGFQFSPALSAHKGEWTPEELNKWLAKPQDYAKGTKMTFVGLPKPEDRANVIAYLNSLSDSPKPLAASQ
jgi:cytochrome c